MRRSGTPIAAPRPIFSSTSTNPREKRLDPDVLTIGFARRAAAYKRGDLIFSDLKRLLKIGKGKPPAGLRRQSASPG